MRAAVIQEVGKTKVIDLPAPDIDADQVRVNIRFVGLCGTDLELFDGSSQYLADKRALFPHRFGHEWVGTVEKVGSRVDTIPVGAVVTGSTMLCCLECSGCRSGHRNRCSRLAEIGLYGWAGAAAEKLVVPAHAVAIVAPSGEPRAEDVLIEPLATVIEATRLVHLSAADKVLIIGAGTMGSLAALVAAHHPVRVDIVEPGGLRHLDRALFDNHYSSVNELRGNYDVILECSGAMGVFGSARAHLRAGGAFALVGVGHPETVDLGELALSGHKITGVRHGVDHYEAAVRMHQRFRKETEELIDQIFPLDDVANAFERLKGTRNQPKVVIQVV